MADEMVPFLMVDDMPGSIAFYVDGLGYAIEVEWRPDGQLKWCQLRKAGAALMLQEYDAGNAPSPRGTGVRLCVMCDDAVGYYHEFTSRGVEAKEPYVGNRLWVTSVIDPDGYHLDFESPADVAEETKLSEVTS